MQNLEVFIESYVFTHKLRKRRTVLRGHASFEKKLALTRVSMGFVFDWEPFLVLTRCQSSSPARFSSLFFIRWERRSIFSTPKMDQTSNTTIVSRSAPYRIVVVLVVRSISIATTDPSLAMKRMMVPCIVSATCEQTM